jgi:hypothetical protein
MRAPIGTATMPRVTIFRRGNEKVAPGDPRPTACRRVAMEGLILAAATLAREAPPDTPPERTVRAAGRFGRVEGEPRGVRPL